MELPLAAVARTVWYVIAAAWVLHVGLRSSRRAFGLGIALALASAPLLFIGASNFEVDTQSIRPVCQPLNKSGTQNIRLCLSAARDHERPTMEQALDPMLSYLPHDYVVGDEALQSFDRMALDATLTSTSGGSAAHKPSQNEVLAYFLANLFQGQPCPGSTADPSAGRPRDLVYYYVDQKLSRKVVAPFVPTAPPPEALTWTGSSASFRQTWNTFSTEERDAYIRQNWRTLTGCRE